MTMPDLSNLLAPVLARLDAIEADVRALRPPPAPPGWNVRAALDAIAAKVDAVGMPDAPTFEKIAAAYTRQTLALGEAQDERAAAIKEAEWLRAELADLRRQRDEIGRRASTQDDDLRAIVGARGGETFRDGVVRLAKERDAAIARAERAEAALSASLTERDRLSEALANVEGERAQAEASEQRMGEECDAWRTATGCKDPGEATRLRASGPASDEDLVAEWYRGQPHADENFLSRNAARRRVYNHGVAHGRASVAAVVEAARLLRTVALNAASMLQQIRDGQPVPHDLVEEMREALVRRVDQHGRATAATVSASPAPIASPPDGSLRSDVPSRRACDEVARLAAPVAPQPAKGERYVGRLRKGHIPMITPAHLPELERLLVAIVEAEDDFDAACQSRDHDAADAASDALTHVRDELSALARRAAAEPTPAPVGMEEILALVEEYGDACTSAGDDPDRESDAYAEECAVRAAISRALAARDERIAALERTESILRSVANVRTDGTIEQIAARVDADLARRAAEWERMADDVAAANVEATARIAALEAGLRDAADDLADHERWWRTVDEIAKADDALASISAARALADAGKVTP